MAAIQRLQERAEARAVIAATFAEMGRYGQARLWAAKAEESWQQWVAAMEAA